MQNYEITYLRADEEADSSVKKIIEELGGKIQQVEFVGKKRLIYPIAKHDMCHFYTIRFSMTGKQIITVSNLVKELPEIVRYLIVSKKAITSLAPEAKPEAKAETKPTATEEPKQEKKTVRKTTVKTKAAKTAEADKKTTTKKETSAKKSTKTTKTTKSSGEQDKKRLATLNEKLDELLKE